MSKFQKLKVKKIRRETPLAVSIHFEKPSDGSFDYIPGQYLTLKVNNGETEVRRAYSLCSSPTVDSDLIVAVKEVEGGTASIFLNRNLKEGDELEVFPPMGKFVHKSSPDAQNHYVVFAGGSGITPIHSIQKTILFSEPKSKVTLIYGNRDSANEIFSEEIQSLKSEYQDRFRVIKVMSEPEEGWSGLVGLIDRHKTLEIVQGIMTSDAYPKSFYLCGPAPMMEEIKMGLGFLGIKKKSIFQELFTAPLPSTDEADINDKVQSGESKRGDYTVKVILDGEEKSIFVKESTNLLDAAIEDGMDPPYACQLGICCTCRALLKSGKADMVESEGLSDQEIEEGYILTCQSYALTSDVVIEFG